MEVPMFPDIARLFASPLRIKLIKFFALQPESRFEPTAVAKALSAGKDAVRTELASLARIGILGAKAGKGSRTFAWNADYPRARAIQNFVLDTTAPDDKTVQSVFRPLGVHLVIVAGALAEETRSSADLLIVTKRPGDPRIAKAVRRLEAMTAVPIRYAVMEVGEYVSRRESYDRLLRDITDFRHRVVLSRT